MLKMTMIWVKYIQFLIEQNLVTKTRILLNKTLQMLPITQHKKNMAYIYHGQSLYPDVKNQK